MKKDKKLKYSLIAIILLLLVAGIYYYIALPAINIHASGFWFAMMVMTVALMFVTSLKRISRELKDYGRIEAQTLKNMKSVKIFGLVLIAIVAVYLVGSILSSPIINASRYRDLLNVEEREFTEDISEADYTTIPLLDRDSAALLGDRKMGSLVEMVSQFEVADDYSQINYQGKPVRVTPLAYASPIKWLTNRKSGIPAYIMIDMTTQDTECVMLEDGIKYSKSEHFGRNLYRHLRFKYPTFIFGEQLFFEIDETGHPFWVCPVKKFNIGLFGGQTVAGAVLCDAVTGDCVYYKLEEIPSWVDKVHSAELLINLYDYHGVFVHGFFNSILGQKDCLQTTEGYNYIALEDDVWVYTGITSVNGDQANVGFVLMNQRTMEARYYTIEGATETSAMSSAEGQVQNLGYTSTFPLLLNISGEPTYFVALKDAYGLVKKYAMINIQKYQWVAIGDTVQECEKNYSSLLATNGIVSEASGEIKAITGKIEVTAPVVLDGNTHYYVCLEGQMGIFDADLSKEELVGVIRLKPGDRVEISYIEGDGELLEITAVKEIS